MPKESKDHDRGQPSHIEPLSPAVTSIQDVDPEARKALAEIAKLGDDRLEDSEHEELSEAEAAALAAEDEDEDDPTMAPRVRRREDEEEAPPPPQKKPKPQKPRSEEPEEEATEEEPATVVDPKLESSLLRIKEREKALKEQEAQLVSKIEKVNAWHDRQKSWKIDRLAAVKGHIADALGTTDEAAIKDELLNLHDEIVLTVLEIPSTPEKKAASKVASLQRELEAHKRETKAAAEKAESERQQREYEAAISNAVSQLDDEFRKLAADYPYLALEEKPGEVIWGLLSNHYERTGEKLTLADAAGQLDKAILSRAEKYRHLLSGRSEDMQPPKAKTGARALTNADASRTSQKPPKRRGYEPDRAKSIRAALSLLPRMEVEPDEEDED